MPRRRPFVSGALIVAASLTAAPAAVAQTAPQQSQTPVVETTQVVSPSPPAAYEPSSPSISQLFRDTAGDFRRLPSRSALKWIAFGAGVSLFAQREDAGVTGTLMKSRSLRGAFAPGQTIGGDAIQVGGAVAAYSIGRLTHNARAASLGADLIRAQALTQTLTYAIKFAAKRTRPDGSSRSFPSGHAAATFASATVLQSHFGWKAGIPAYAVASYVAASRLQMNRHYLSDVTFGAVLGILSARTVTVGRGDARFAVGPMAAPGGGGVSFTWIGIR